MKRVTKNPDVRYQEFIEIAIRLFSERGYEGVTVRDILEEVQGTQGMFYHYFKSKQDLYEQTMKILKDRVMENRYAILVDEKRSLQSKVREVKNMITLDISRYQGVLTGQQNRVFRLEVNEQLMSRLIDGFAIALKQALAKGEIKETDMINEKNVAFFSAFFVSGLNGAMLKAELLPGEGTEELLENLLQTLVAFVSFKE